VPTDDYAPYNWDLFQHPPETATKILETHCAGITSAYHLADPNDPVEVAFNNDSAEFFRDYLPPYRDPTEPLSEIYYVSLYVFSLRRLCPSPVHNVFQPILESVGSIQIGDPLSRPVRGLIAISFYWRDLISDVLPSESYGIFLVFENKCNPTFTYLVNGPNVSYLGRGDFHDPRYDHLELGVSSVSSAKGLLRLRMLLLAILTLTPICSVGNRPGSSV
jgi:hypothetical protein